MLSIVVVFMVICDGESKVTDAAVVLWVVVFR